MTVIVISGLPGCGSSTLGRLLAEKLGLKFFSLGKKFKEHGGTGTETDKAINVWNSEKGDKKDFHESLDDMQVRLAKEGNIVIDAKLGIHFLKDLANLCVWIHAPIKIRAERVASRENWTIEQALKKLEEKAKLEKELFMKVYGIDYLSQEKNADLAIDVSSERPNEIVEKILTRLNKV